MEKNPTLKMVKKCKKPYVNRRHFQAKLLLKLACLIAVLSSQLDFPSTGNYNNYKVDVKSYSNFALGSKISEKKPCLHWDAVSINWKRFEIITCT